MEGEIGNACGCECAANADRKEEGERVSVVGRRVFNVDWAEEGRGGSGGGTDASLERLPLWPLDLRDDVRDRGGRGRGYCNICNRGRNKGRGTGEALSSVKRRRRFRSDETG